MIILVVLICGRGLHMVQSRVPVGDLVAVVEQAQVVLADVELRYADQKRSREVTDHLLRTVAILVLQQRRLRFLVVVRLKLRLFVRQRLRRVEIVPVWVVHRQRWKRCLRVFLRLHRRVFCFDMLH